MALTPDSIAGTARRKARRAHDNVKAAEEELVAANEALKDALPARDIEAIAHAAERTVVAEEEVRQAAHELEGVDELLQVDVGARAQELPATGGASGEGARSLLPFLNRGR